MRRLLLLRVAFSIATAVEVFTAFLYIFSPLLVFRGGVEGFYSLYTYRITFFGEPVKSDVLGYTNSMALLAVFVYALLQVLAIATAFSKRLEYIELSFGAALVSIPCYGVLSGLTAVALRELSRIPTTSRLETLAGTIVFPGTQVFKGAAQSIATAFLIISAVKLALIAMLFYTLLKELTSAGL